MVHKKLSMLSALGIGAALVAAQASASNVLISGNAETLTFGGEVNSASINTFFDAGTDSHGEAGGAANNVGITFSSTAVFQNAGFNGTGFSGGTGKFENVPSHATGVLAFTAVPTNTVGIMDDSSGFTSLSFNYSLLTNSLLGNSETVSLYSGLDGTGSLLGTIALSASTSPVACTGPRDEFCSWSTASDSSLAGVARSAVFSSGIQGAAEFDALTVTAAPVPLPASIWLMFGGVAGLFGVARRQQKAA
jgi:hypothetical protein